MMMLVTLWLTMEATGNHGNDNTIYMQKLSTGVRTYMYTFNVNCYDYSMYMR